MDSSHFITNKMFAVIKNKVIVDIAWGIETNAKSIKLNKYYPSDSCELIEVTEFNSPMTLGQIYIGV